MGDVQVIFDTLKWRHRLPENILAESSQFDMALTAQVRYLVCWMIALRRMLKASYPVQSPPRTFDGKGSSVSPGAAHSVLVMANLAPSLETAAPQSTFRLSRDNVSEIECAPTGQPDVPYEFSYARFLGEV
jgi:hypothetical protein